MPNLDDKKIIDASRLDLIAFGLFWYLCVLNEDKASKQSFEVVKKAVEKKSPFL